MHSTLPGGKLQLCRRTCARQTLSKTLAMATACPPTAFTAEIYYASSLKAPPHSSDSPDPGRTTEHRELNQKLSRGSAQTLPPGLRRRPRSCMHCSAPALQVHELPGPRRRVDAAVGWRERGARQGTPRGAAAHPCGRPAAPPPRTPPPATPWASETHPAASPLPRVWGGPGRLCPPPPPRLGAGRDGPLAPPGGQPRGDNGQYDFTLQQCEERQRTPSTSPQSPGHLRAATPPALSHPGAGPRPEAAPARRLRSTPHPSPRSGRRLPAAGGGPRRGTPRATAGPLRAPRLAVGPAPVPASRWEEAAPFRLPGPGPTQEASPCVCEEQRGRRCRGGAGRARRHGAGPGLPAEGRRCPARWSPRRAELTRMAVPPLRPPPATGGAGWP